jgi:pyruvate dehydrogenase E1 component
MKNNKSPAVVEQEDVDPTETQEWIDALKAVMEIEGETRAQFLIEKLVAVAR